MATDHVKNIGVAGWDTPNLGKPEFPQALNGESGLIDREQLDLIGGLVVKCPIWQFPDDGDEMQVEYSRRGETLWIPLDAIHFPAQPSGPFVEVTINYDLLGHGEFDLRFKVKPGSGGDYSDFSEQQRVRIDLYAPYKSPGRSEAPARIVFPPELPINVDITQDVLDLNPGGFSFFIPGYPDFESGDTVADFWFTQKSPPDDEPSLASVPMESGGVEVVLTIASFEGLEDGNYFAFYRLKDAAKNISLVSRVQTGRKLKRSAGLTLDSLVVVSPPGGALIDIEAWEAGVKVVIPTYPWASGDQYRLKWGNQTTSLAALNGVFPFEILVPPQVIVDEYADKEGEVSTPLSYEILRAGSISVPDDDTLALVDLSVEGPPGTLPGDPSPDLVPVTIIGPASAPTTNYINSADIDHADPILARSTLWTVLPAPAEDAVITLYWGNKLNPAGSYTIGAGDSPGDLFEIEVDKSAIAAAGNGDSIPVFYGVSRPGAANSNYSTRTPVEVDDAITHVLETAVFTDFLPWSGDTRGRITCASLRPTGTGVPEGSKHIRVWIPASTEFFKDGTEVTFEYVASTGLMGDQPIEPTRGETALTLDENMARNGFFFELKPFDPHLKVAGALPPFNSIWFQYSVDVDGTPAKSIPAVIPARMVTANNFCDGSSVP
jgi:hypothetical protein